MRRARRGFGRFLRRDDGATAVEFALVMGPLFFLLGCIVEMSLMLFSEYTLQDGVQEAGRMIRTNPPTNSSAIRTAICERAPTLANCTVLLGTSLQSALNYGDLETIKPTLTTVVPRSDVYTKPDPSTAVVLLATYDWTFIFPGLNLLSNVVAGGNFRRLQGIAVFQVEPL